MSSVIVIDKEKCIGCGLCAKDCPYRAIRIQDHKAEMFLSSCMECGHCFAICPQHAVHMRGYDEKESLPCSSIDEISPEAFLNHLKARRSIRKFQKKMVEREKIQMMIEAARYTPTAANLQNVRYVVMENPCDKIEPAAIHLFSKGVELLHVAERFKPLPFTEEMLDVKRGFFFHEAPVAVFVISESAVNASLISTSIETMAETQGLGVLYVGLFVSVAKLSPKIRQMLGIQGREKLVTALAIGYPAVRYQRTIPRKPADVTYR